MKNKALQKAKKAKLSYQTYNEKFANLFLDAYKEQNCLLVKTCKAIGLHPDTIKNWENAHPEFAEQKAILDMEQAEDVEQHLIGNATGEKHQGVPVAQIFYLKNNHPKYAEQKAPKIENVNFWWNKSEDTPRGYIEGEVIDENKADKKTTKL